MENNSLAKFLKLLDDFRDNLKNGKNKEALELLERIRKLYLKETGRKFEDDFPEEKIENLYSVLGSSYKGNSKKESLSMYDLSRHNQPIEDLSTNENIENERE